MAAAVRNADGWNLPFPGLDHFRKRMDALRVVSDEASRDLSTLTVSVNLGLAWNDAARERQFRETPDLLEGVLGGSTQQVIDKVAAYRDAGAEWLIIATRSPFDLEAIDRFATDVVPAVIDSES